MELKLKTFIIKVLLIGIIFAVTSHCDSMDNNEDSTEECKCSKFHEI